MGDEKEGSTMALLVARERTSADELDRFMEQIAIEGFTDDCREQSTSLLEEQRNR